RRVFDAKNEWEMAQQHFSKKPDLPDVPEAERNVVLRALAKEPDQLFPSCAAFVQALKEAMAPAKPEIPARGWDVRVIAVVALMAIAVAVMTLALYVVLRRPQVWQPKGWNPVDANDLTEADKDPNG